eukprot:1160320-Pelagomonas_calceolata.AAC.2
MQSSTSMTSPIMPTFEQGNVSHVLGECAYLLDEGQVDEFIQIKLAEHRGRCAVLCCTALHCIVMLCTSFSALHCTSLHCQAYASAYVPNLAACIDLRLWLLVSVLSIEYR